MKCEATCDREAFIFVQHGQEQPDGTYSRHAYNLCRECSKELFTKVNPLLQAGKATWTNLPVQPKILEE